MANARSVYVRHFADFAPKTASQKPYGLRMASVWLRRRPETASTNVNATPKREGAPC